MEAILNKTQGFLIADSGNREAFLEPNEIITEHLHLALTRESPNLSYLQESLQHVRLALSRAEGEISSFRELSEISRSILKSVIQTEPFGSTSKFLPFNNVDIREIWQELINQAYAIDGSVRSGGLATLYFRVRKKHEYDRYFKVQFTSFQVEQDKAEGLLEISVERADPKTEPILKTFREQLLNEIGFTEVA
ncbi:hypothetical protein [Bdellovibrio sp. HCB209]|uniref:hypothetical protein n=1 Tax=Bdellovibrio sp. HCB209 TaxID=3394354 RepID=UPI0039B3FA6E